MQFFCRYVSHPVNPGAARPELIERLSVRMASMSITVLSFFDDSINTGVVLVEACLS